MKKLYIGIFIFLTFFTINACQETSKNETQFNNTEASDFEYVLDRFADLQILRYKVSGFENLDLQKKKLAYYLYEAALCGRDIIYDQNYKYNLRVRKTLEGIYTTYSGEKAGAEWQQFDIYTKRVWFSNGIHHHYATTKILPGFNKEYFTHLIKNSDESALPLDGVDGEKGLIDLLLPVIFDPAFDAKRVNLEPNVDLLQTSANNLYEGLTEKEAENYYQNLKNEGDNQPPMYGLNSKLVKEDGKISEKVYKVGGLYAEAIEQIVYWLEKAI